MKPSFAQHNTRRFTAEGIEYRFRFCPAGKFVMGALPSEWERWNVDWKSFDEQRHTVMLSHGFWMLETPVTQAMWQSVTGENPSHFQGERLPVEQVNCDECRTFCQLLSELVSMPISLPTEAQWEYACRAGTTGAFAGSGQIREMGWNYADSGMKTHPVGEKRPNDWGLFDMHGNVWEWTADWYGTYPTGPVTDPTGPQQGTECIFRGGSWYRSDRYCRSAYRRSQPPETRNFTLGFRLMIPFDE